MERELTPDSRCNGSRIARARAASNHPAEARAVPSGSWGDRRPSMGLMLSTLSRAAIASREGQHVDQEAVGIDDHEVAHAEVLIAESLGDLEAALHRGGVDGVDVVDLD